MKASDIRINAQISKYLPATLIANWTRSPNQNSIWSEWLNGSLMHCDVTGFTAMNEALASMGHEGAEVMAKILNRFFERMLGIAKSWNGIQMKFGGDAMLVYFPGNQHAYNAATCGLEMQKAMAEFSEVKVHNDTCQLRMRIGIHSGNFFAASVGHEDGLLHYMMSGHDVNRAADVEPLAEPGQVVVSDEMASLVRDKAQLVSTKHDGIWEVTSITHSITSPKKFNFDNAPKSILNRYLMPAIESGKASDLHGDHRRATITFIYLFGLSDLLEQEGESEALRQASEYVKMVMSIAKKYGGVLLASDVAEHADKIVVVFGAPISIADQEGNCLRFAYELKQKMAQSRLDLRHQMGINTGFVFAGEIGSSWRREYTTIGDNMNLAARLMTAAGEGNILVSSNTADRVGDEFEFVELEPIRVKGKSQPIKISRLKSVISSSQKIGVVGNHTIYGRGKELAKLLGFADKAKRGRQNAVFVSGDAGIGKTALCETLVSRLQDMGWQTSTSICQEYDARNAFSAWRYPLHKLCKIKESDSAKNAWNKIESLVGKCCPELCDFTQLIAEILLIPHEVNPVIASLDAKTKREKRIAIIKAVVVSLSKKDPTCFIFDNSSWIDSSSADVIKEISSEKGSRIYIVFISRYSELPEQLSGCDIGLHQILGNLSDRDSLAYVKSLASLDDKMTNMVVRKARGNPLFLRELSKSSVVENGIVPDSIYDVIMVRLDNLEAGEKHLLRSASVIGQVFDVGVLGEFKRLNNGAYHES